MEIIWENDYIIIPDSWLLLMWLYHWIISIKMIDLVVFFGLVDVSGSLLVETCYCIFSKLRTHTGDWDRDTLRHSRCCQQPEAEEPGLILMGWGWRLYASYGSKEGILYHTRIQHKRGLERWSYLLLSETDIFLESKRGSVKTCMNL